MNMWLDGMMGLVTGDALGIPVQFLKREELKNRAQGPVVGMESGGVFHLPAGIWSDDSSMALCALDSIREKQEIDPGDIMKRFVDWETKGEYTPFGIAFDQGNTCMEAIYKYMANPDVATCGKTGEYANGNGALMRILPVCLYYIAKQKTAKADITEETIAGIDAVSALTHNHARSKMACGLYYFMAREIILGKKKQEKEKLHTLLQKGIDEGFSYYGKDIINLMELAHFHRLCDLDAFVELSEDEISSSGYVVDTLEAAVWCLLTTSTLKDCLLKAVNLGGDADTVAAVAGGLAGLYYGYEKIPKEWIREISRRDWIEEMCKW